MRHLTESEAKQLKEMVDAIWGVDCEKCITVTAKEDTKVMTIPFLVSSFVTWSDGMLPDGRPTVGRIDIEIDRWINGARTVRVGCDPKSMILVMAIQ